MPIWGALISAGIGLITANKQRGEARRQAQEQLKLQREQQALLEQQKEEYRQMEFRNPYAGIENQYAGMENVYEDLTVSTQAADFQMEQGAQQRANIMQGLRGAAGGSGIAGLAQTLAGQGALQARQVSTDIAQQEARNVAMRAKGAMTLQQLERQGATAADMAQRQGEAMLMQAESSKQATLLGMQMGATTGAQSAYQQSLLNQQKAGASAQQMQATAFTDLASQKGEDWKQWWDSLSG